MRRYPFKVLVAGRVYGEADTMQSAVDAANKHGGQVAVSAPTAPLAGLATQVAKWQTGAGKIRNPGREGSASDPALVAPDSREAKLVASIDGVLVAGFRNSDRLRCEAAVRDIVAQNKALPRPARVHIVER
jgi:hypothetical protein